MKTQRLPVSPQNDLAMLILGCEDWNDNRAFYRNGRFFNYLRDGNVVSEKRARVISQHANGSRLAPWSKTVVQQFNGDCGAFHRFAEEWVGSWLAKFQGRAA